MVRVRALGIVLFLLGLWVFLAPFTGPAMHLYLSPPPAMSMGMMSNAVVVNRAMVFYNFLPGVALTLIGVYNIFRGQINVTR